MPEENLGSGLYLDSGLDFDPSERGDLRTVSGSEELQKDLAAQLLFTLDEYTGAPLEPAVRSEIRSKTVDTMLADDRVNSVDRGSITVTKPDRNTIRIQLVLFSAGEGQELVFNI